MTSSLFISLVKAKRFPNGLRKCANEIGISSATLSRVENGDSIDIETFYKICVWLNLEKGFCLEAYMGNFKELENYNSEVDR